MMTTVTTKACMICGKTSTIELTDDEFVAVKSNVPIQVALPARDADFRELVLSGIHSDCWDNAFGSFDEED